VRILHGLGAPYSAYWRIDALERAAMNALAFVHVQMLIVEEFQQLIAGSAREQRISLNLVSSPESCPRFSFDMSRSHEINITRSYLNLRHFGLSRDTASQSGRLQSVCHDGAIFCI
jgi:hypothetical protein